MTTTDSLLVEESPGVAWLTLNRPDKLNPLDRDTIGRLLTEVRRLEERADIRVVVLTGRGRAFSAGGDLSGYLELYRRPDDFRAYLNDFFALCDGIERSAKIYLAAVNGVTVAGGLEVMLACDFVLIAEGAKIGDGHLNFAQLPGGGGSQRLPRTVGPLQAKRLILTGEMIDAAEAVAIGLATKAVPAADLRHATQELTKDLLAKSPAALKGSKYLINSGLAGDLASGLALEMDYVHGYATGHPDAMEGLEAFRDKRPPSYREAE